MHSRVFRFGKPQQRRAATKTVDDFDRQMLAAGKRYADGVKADPVGTRRENLRSRIERLQAQGKLDGCYADALERHMLNPADAAGLDQIEAQISQMESGLTDGQDDATIKALADSQVAKIHGSNRKTG